MSSGESLCIRLPTSSVVRKTFFGTAVAADKRLIIVVVTPERGVAAPDRLVHFQIRLFRLQPSCRSVEDEAILHKIPLFAAFTRCSTVLVVDVWSGGLDT